MIRSFTLLFVVVIFIYTIQGIRLNPSADKICQPVNCRGHIKTCPYGYQKQDGCEICKCYDPCNPPGKAFLCGPNKRCFVDKKSDGTFVACCGSSHSKRNEDVCEQEKVIGLCKAAFPRFYFNSTMKSCEQFIFGGCGGNNNNFVTKVECETACVT